jgi:hypothetical protein
MTILISFSVLYFRHTALAVITYNTSSNVKKSTQYQCFYLSAWVKKENIGTFKYVFLPFCSFHNIPKDLTKG